MAVTRAQGMLYGDRDLVGAALPGTEADGGNLSSSVERESTP